MSIGSCIIVFTELDLRVPIFVLKMVNEFFSIYKNRNK